MATPPTEPKNILLTGGRAPVTLDLARLFSEAGHRVYVAESLPLHLCHFSNAVTRCEKIPAPNHDLQGFADGLSRIITTHNIDLLVPTCEEVFHVSRVMDTLPKQCAVFTTEIETLTKLHSKSVFIETATALGLEVPKTQVVTSMAQVLERLARKERFVLKRVFSRFSTHTVVLPTTPADLKGVEISAAHPWVIQEYLGDKQYCSYTLVHQGEMTAHTVYPTTYTAGQGSSIYFTPTVSEDIYRWIKTFVAAIGYTGQLSFDFIETPDGKILPIECNPRATSGVHLFTPPDHIDQAFLHPNTPLCTPANPQPAMLALAMLLYGAPMALRHKGMAKWRADWRTGRDVLFSRTDPLPALGQFLCFALFAWLALRHRKDMLAVSTLDIEFNGEPQAETPA
jgi:predicted ATP-grasp superfamily ATP-dependent carboligase